MERSFLLNLIMAGNILRSFLDIFKRVVIYTHKHQSFQMFVSPTVLTQKLT